MSKEELRLQKYLARCGIASRRSCEKLIEQGRISVNDKITTKMGTKIDPETDVVKFDGEVIVHTNENITLMLNKPAGYVSTMSDPQGRPCVADLVPIDEYLSLFPVGRLDRLTRGLLIFTTDGQLGQDLLHPKNEVAKKYEAIIDGELTPSSEAYKKLTEGVEILGGKTSPAKVEVLEHFAFDKYLEFENDFFSVCASKNDQSALPNEKDLVDKKFSRISIEIHEGKNRQVRRMFEAVGYTVLLLERVSIGNLKLDNLDCGKWRKLEESEVEFLKG